MFRKVYLLGALFFVSIYFLGNVEAGCNGSCEVVDGQDWTVNLDTHMWDEDIAIDDLNVNIGASLKLENVNISVKGKVNIYANTEWISSNITLLREDASSNVTIYDKLEIIASEVTIYVNLNDTGNFDATNAKGFYIEHNGEMVVRDLDDNNETTNDASTIKPYQLGEYPYGYATWEIIGTESSEQTFIVKNSVFIDIWTSQIYANNVLFSGNSVYGDRDIYFHGDNLTYSNNKHYAKEYNSTRSNVGCPRALGENSYFKDNLFQDGGCGPGVQGGSNALITNNTFINLTSNVVWANTSPKNITISNNKFVSINTAAWIGNASNVVFVNNTITNSSYDYTSYFSGSNITITSNNFSRCASSCLLLTNLGYQANQNITISKNYFFNYTGNGIQLGTENTEHKGTFIEHNSFHNGGTGISAEAWYAYTKHSSNVNIYNNNYDNLTYGIKLNFFYGEDFLIYNNTISNSSNAIYITGSSSTVQNLTIENNNIISNSNGIVYYCSTYNSEFINNIIQYNLFDGDGLSSSLTTCKGDILFFNNTIYTSKIAFDLHSSEAVIDANTVIGNCQAEDCLKVSFNKVAEKGIRLHRNSEASIINNNFSNFYYSIYLENSESVIQGNNINFTNTGIYSISSQTNVNDNLISNSYVGVDTIDSINSIQDTDIITFEIGIQSHNSNLSFNEILMDDGNICFNMIDSNYSILNYENYNCIDTILFEKYFINVKIQTNDGIPAAQHPFEFTTSLQQRSGLTNSNGYSEYYLITTKKVDNSGLESSFNPIQITYNHNNIANTITKHIDKNQTFVAELDTVPPSTVLTANGTVINSLDIYLNFEKTSLKSDLLNYDIYVLTNDGFNFAEWQFLGTFNSSIVKFEAQDGFKYRFKSQSRDIYGNIELKYTYDCEIEVDIDNPASYFASIDSEYYFANIDEVLLIIGSDSNDIEKYEISIEYTNFTTSYLNPSTVVWNLIDKRFFYDKTEFVFNLSKEGHYGFKIEATDFAGNKEIKEDYDFIINFDPNSDTLSFSNIPERWGSETLEINLADSDFNLDFRLFLAMESINYENPYFTWYEHQNSEDSGLIVIQGLLDKTRYYLYAESIDLAGNIENPLDTTEFFSSNGEYDQIFSLKYMPLLLGNYDFIVDIDNDLDGNYETKLAKGTDLGNLGSNQFYVDQKNKTLHFGGVINGGFVPNQDLGKINNIKVSYSGAHAIFEVYTGNPQPAQNLEIIPTNISHITFEYDVPTNSDNCKVQRTTNLSKGWFNQEILSPCLKGTYVYEHLNPEPNSKYFYRILIEDEFGHVSVSENRSVDMTDLVKIYNSDNAVQSDQSIDTVILLTATVGALMLGFGGVLLYRTRNKDNMYDNVTAIESKPVAKYKVEELYLIYKDGRLIKNISAVKVKTDSDIMSGMLTAINDFVQDSFNTEGDLGDIGYGNNKIILQRGNNSYLAAVIYGEVDNYFKGKLINAVRSIESKNPNMDNWNGDSESISKVKISLKPIIDETSSVTREMVDNYFTEKDLVITTNSEKMGDIINLKVNISNYSSSIIQNCKIKPEINSSILSIIGIEPDLAYHFKENSFSLGEIDSYNEVYLEIKLRAKKSEDTAVEIKMNYKMKDKEGDLSSVVQIN